jgi:hypothetical protein
LFETLFRQLLERAQQVVYAQGGPRKFRFKNKLMPKFHPCSHVASFVDSRLGAFCWFYVVM